MSTFKGHVEEFPEIAIDFFSQDASRKPPLACFLSHIHSDHLKGLETFQSPFIYCSPATSRLLLKLESRWHRLNFEQGLLETRTRRYRHLKKVLKTIPLDTPTRIELRPGYAIKVTLLDANHCAGAVMFLIQGDSKTILYTGDIRSEAWWVESLKRHPVMIPFTHGLKTIDKVYLDTTFATTSLVYQRFHSKADGIRELLQKVMILPENTVFHFNAWTPGYEDVWRALSSALNSQIHVDEYKFNLYQSLGFSATVDVNPCHESSIFSGFHCGNHRQEGCLTRDPAVRLHSCERGTGCEALKSPNTVFITPIITRKLDGESVPEQGAGDRSGDFGRGNTLELPCEKTVKNLIELFGAAISDPVTRIEACTAISQAFYSGKQMIPTNALHLGYTSEDSHLPSIVQSLAKVVNGSDTVSLAGMETASPGIRDSARGVIKDTNGRPGTLEFPFSRHSSYEELCNLVSALRPLDVYPCTADEDDWSAGMTMQNLFGQFCTGNTFAYDEAMAAKYANMQLQIQSNDWRMNRTDVVELLLPKRSTIVYSSSDERSRKKRRGSLPPENEKHASQCPAGDLVYSARENNSTVQSSEGDAPSDSIICLQRSSEASPSERVKAIREHFYDHVERLNRSIEERLGHNRSPATGNLLLEAQKQVSVNADHRHLSSGKVGPSQQELFQHRLRGNSSPIGVDGSSSSMLLDQSRFTETEGNSGENIEQDEMQAALSDAAFDSQTTESSIKSQKKRQRRKTAYMHATALHASHEVDFGLISSGSNHYDEDVEL